jgi:hypothetical protein
MVYVLAMPEESKTRSCSWCKRIVNEIDSVIMIVGVHTGGIIKVQCYNLPT